MLGHLCCRTWAQYPGGDHEIIVGEVVFADGRDGDPLLFHQGRLQRSDPGMLSRA
jgi:3-hydroxy-9,10-secoandrosta-1,3,5(10)-triene-9,17-dione monooxygenase reductase component